MRSSKRLLFVRMLSSALGLGLITSMVALGVSSKTQAQGRVIYIGITLPFTGAEAEDAELMKAGVLMAIEEQNAKGGVGDHKIEAVLLDNGTATAGQYDPAQAASNAKKLVANVGVVANIGPMMSGEGKAISAMLSEADMATITPSATNPDLTDPKFAPQYRPKGKAVFFRMVTTDAYQGPNMANYLAEKLKVKSVYVLDDGGAYGVGIANAFQRRAAEKGVKILGRDQLNPKEADYTTAMTKIKGLNPDALYFGGSPEAAVKLAKQSYDVMPKVIKCGADALYSASVLKGAGFPAVEGWYATLPAPDILSDPEAQPWAVRFAKRWGKQPSNYSITAYDATLVILDAVRRVVQGGKQVDRHTVRDAIQETHLKTLQGVISFDANGDLRNTVISVYQVVHNPKYPDDDVVHQLKYIGTAPEN